MKRIAIQIEFETMDELRAYLAMPVSVAPGIEVVEPEPVVVDVATEIPEVDADGVKWDERIHSSSKKLTAKGVWARRKNLTDEEFNAVKAQAFKEAGLTPAPVPPPAPAPVTEVVVPTPPAPTPLPPPPPTPSPIVTPVPGNGGIVVLLKLCSDLQGQGKLTQEMKDQAAQAVGLQDFKQIFLSPKAELVNQLATVISSMVA